MVDAVEKTEVTITLKQPIVMKERTISEITLREPTAAQLDMAEDAGKRNDMARTIKLIALVSNNHENVIRNMLGSDLAKASKIVTDFLDIGQETGENSSQT